MSLHEGRPSRRAGPYLRHHHALSMGMDRVVPQMNATQARVQRFARSQNLSAAEAAQIGGGGAHARRKRPLQAGTPLYVSAAAVRPAPARTGTGASDAAGDDGATTGNAQKLFGDYKMLAAMSRRSGDVGGEARAHFCTGVLHDNGGAFEVRARSLAFCCCELLLRVLLLPLLLATAAEPSCLFRRRSRATARSCRWRTPPGGWTRSWWL